MKKNIFMILPSGTIENSLIFFCVLTSGRRSSWLSTTFFSLCANCYNLGQIRRDFLLPSTANTVESSEFSLID